MGSLTITKKILDRYFGYLRRFDNDTKKRLIIKLTNSLEVKNTNTFDLDLLFGAWKDDKTTNEIITEIRDSRIEPRNLKSF